MENIRAPLQSQDLDPKLDLTKGTNLASVRLFGSPRILLPPPRDAGVTRGHGATPLSMKGDIKDVSSELDNGG
ncbi:hypothetical protein TNCV_356571 [Trichonephila clavipes]|nr:hypothetical protein TNCV_356571 [Trichonephila clavipes]